MFEKKETEDVRIGGRIHGHMTLRRSKSMPDAVKDSIVKAPEGKKKVLRKVLVDPETGEQVIVKGELRVANTGSLSAFINFMVENVECLLEDKVEKATSKPKPKFDVDAVAKKLSLM